MSKGILAVVLLVDEGGESSRVRGGAQELRPIDW